MFYMDRDAKVSTVTPSSDLLLRVKGQKRSNFKNISNRKNNSVNMFYIDRDAKVSMVTLSSDVQARGQRSKAGCLARVLLNTSFFFLLSFFLLSMFQIALASICYIRFSPDLVTIVTDYSHLCYMTVTLI